MSLYLAESVLPQNLREREILGKAAEQVAIQAKENHSALIEVQAADDLSRVFFILESEDQKIVRELLTRSEIPVTLVKQVRLVGADLEETRRNPAEVKYLVEWNLPEGLTMEAYLNRKKANSVHYADVPEVTFQRTYVCEDLTKCLCLYEAPGKDSIYKAREAVGAPVDAITETIRISIDKEN